MDGQQVKKKETREERMARYVAEIPQHTANYKLPPTRNRSGLQFNYVSMWVEIRLKWHVNMIEPHGPASIFFRTPRSGVSYDVMESMFKLVNKTDQCWAGALLTQLYLGWQNEVDEQSDFYIHALTSRHVKALCEYYGVNLSDDKPLSLEDMPSCYKNVLLARVPRKVFRPNPDGDEPPSDESETDLPSDDESIKDVDSIIVNPFLDLSLENRDAHENLEQEPQADNSTLQDEELDSKSGSDSDSDFDSDYINNFGIPSMKGVQFMERRKKILEANYRDKAVAAGVPIPEFTWDWLSLGLLRQQRTEDELRTDEDSMAPVRTSDETWQLKNKPEPPWDVNWTSASEIEGAGGSQDELEPLSHTQEVERRQRADSVDRALEKRDKRKWQADSTDGDAVEEDTPAKKVREERGRKRVSFGDSLRRQIVIFEDRVSPQRFRMCH
ncbi:MAG: hypothetical protein LQ340_002135 [Diploschistes diacapsis]|nr:MAG: hypothetical protein LQ340_002135 [Diploschistes diacapsis]